MKVCGQHWLAISEYVIYMIYVKAWLSPSWSSYSLSYQTRCPYWGTNRLPLLGDKQIVLIGGQTLNHGVSTKCTNVHVETPWLNMPKLIHCSCTCTLIYHQTLPQHLILWLPWRNGNGYANRDHGGIIYWKLRWTKLNFSQLYFSRYR